MTGAAAMALRLEPAGRTRARLRVPGDKSISHRALLLGALARGRSRATNLAPGGDVEATRDALAALGAGGSDAWRATAPIDCRNSGTTARLLLGVLAPRVQGEVVLTGDASLRGRPMARVADPLRAMGAWIEGAEGGPADRLPLAIAGRALRGGEHRLAVASAQVKSALLIAGLAAEGDTSVVEPARSRDHTERLLRAMGADITRAAEGQGSRVTIRAGALEPLEIEVPGDLSSAAPFLALAAARPGGEIVVEDVGLNPTRAGFLEVLKRMGARVEIEVEDEDPEPRGRARVSGAPLQAVEIEAAEVPLMIDELPLVAVLATQAEGRTIVRGAAELRIKESDRIAAVAAGLAAMGARIEPRADGFEVEGPVMLRGAALDAANDHRIAMALAVAALLAGSPSRLEGAEWVAISYPGFFDDLAAAAGSGIRAGSAR